MQLFKKQKSKLYWEEYNKRKFDRNRYIISNFEMAEKKWVDSLNSEKEKEKVKNHVLLLKDYLAMQDSIVESILKTVVDKPVDVAFEWQEKAVIQTKLAAKTFAREVTKILKTPIYTSTSLNNGLRWSLIVFFVISCTNKGSDSSIVSNAKSQVNFKTEEEKIFYAMGAKFGEPLSSIEISDVELRALAQGLTDSAKNNVADLGDNKEYLKKVQNLINGRKNKLKKGLVEQGRAFAKNFLSKEGVKKAASGLVYKIIDEGKGSKPGDLDVVEMHYKASLTDGTVFASSRNTGKVAKYPLDKIISGWAEGLKLIAPGGRVKLVIPPELAYGENGAPPKVPGGATLVFDVELLSVIKKK